MNRQWSQTVIEHPDSAYIITPRGYMVEILEYDIYDDKKGLFIHQKDAVCQVKEGNVIVLQPDKVRVSTHENAN